VHIGLDGVPVTTGAGSVGLTNFTAGAFTWQKSNISGDTTIVIPAPGTYTLYVWMREDGIVLDKIWLSMGGAYPDSDTRLGP
jgi:hypothetical protein